MKKENLLNSFLIIIIGVLVVVGSVSAATTISTSIFTEGAISSNATSTASAFVATSTTATSTFAGNVSVAGNLTVASCSGCSGASSGTKVYRALLSQSGTDAPVATVLENSLGGTVVWTRSGAGYYIATLAGAFPDNKTLISLMNYNESGNNVELGSDTSPNSIYFYQYATLSTTAIDGNNNDGIEILVYP